MNTVIYLKVISMSVFTSFYRVKSKELKQLSPNFSLYRNSSSSWSLILWTWPDTSILQKQTTDKEASNAIRGILEQSPTPEFWPTVKFGVTVNQISDRSKLTKLLAVTAAESNHIHKLRFRKKFKQMNRLKNMFSLFQSCVFKVKKLWKWTSIEWYSSILNM